MALTKAESGKTRIGWIGAGITMRWMCERAMTKGYGATICSRSKNTVDVKALLDEGAKWANTPKGVAEQSDVVFATIGWTKDARDVFLGPQGVLAGSNDGTIMVDMTTSKPAIAREIDAALDAKGIYSRARVFGNGIGDRYPAHSIIIRGNKDVVEAVRPIFECMGRTIIHQGPAGAGQHAMMVDGCEGLRQKAKAAREEIGSMTAPRGKRLFVSYAHADRKALDALTPHLKLLGQRGYIEAWDDRQLIAGEEWHEEICDRLHNADVIVLIVSTEFLVSSFIRQIELRIALQRWNVKKAIVLWVPLEKRNLHDQDEQEAAIKKLHACTPNARPIRDFRPQKDGWLEVENALQRAIEHLRLDPNG